MAMKLVETKISGETQLCKLELMLRANDSRIVPRAKHRARTRSELFALTSEQPTILIVHALCARPHNSITSFEPSVIQ